MKLKRGKIVKGKAGRVGWVLGKYGMCKLVQHGVVYTLVNSYSPTVRI